MAKKLTDLTGDGKVTQADVLKGRGVLGFAKGKKRYADGGTVDEELVVEGMRPENFDLEGLSRARVMGPSMPRGGGGGGGGGMPAPAMSSAPARAPMPVGRTGPRGASYLGPMYRGEDGSRMSAGVGPRGSFGVGLDMPFKKGGKVKKMAKGGSTASKRADGCATKGKTKGRFV